MTDLNKITNDLLLKYDEKFNEKYNEIVQLNSSIMNKEEIIRKENDELFSKERTIQLLQTTILFVFLLSISFLLFTVKMYSKNFFITLVVIIIFICLFLYYRIYHHINRKEIENVIGNIHVNMKDFVQEIGLGHNYQCPVSCPPKSNHSPIYGSISTMNQPTLNIDPQTNVWKYGDIPESNYTSTVVPGNDFYVSPKNIPNYRSNPTPTSEDLPAPSFGTTSPMLTYYECQWLGGDSESEHNNGLPNVESQYSSIPCSYRQNVTEKNRYICKDDPNKVGLSVCESVGYSDSFSS
jgi:hypothetical protein